MVVAISDELGPKNLSIPKPFTYWVKMCVHFWHDKKSRRNNGNPQSTLQQLNLGSFKVALIQVYLFYSHNMLHVPLTLT